MGVRWSRMSWSEKNELWKRWRRGETLRDIAHGLRRAPSVVYAAVGAEGGIAPRPRRRSRIALTTTEREEISRQLAQGQSLRTISRILRRAPSTISREVARNGRRGVYRAAVADAQAWRRSRRPQPCRLSSRPALRRAVAQKLAPQWSPQQISGWLRRTFPSDPNMQVSPETIYRSLFVQSRGVLKRRLLQQLRRQHHFRHARAAARRHFRPRQGQILDAVSIRQRPAEVEDRAVPGHWEGDLLEGLSRHLHCHARRTPIALRDACSFAEQGNADRDSRTSSSHSTATAGTHAIADVGSRHRTRRASRAYHCHRRPRVLL